MALPCPDRDFVLRCIPVFAIIPDRLILSSDIIQWGRKQKKLQNPLCQMYLESISATARTPLMTFFSLIRNVMLLIMSSRSLWYACGSSLSIKGTLIEVASIIGGGGNITVWQKENWEPFGVVSCVLIDILQKMNFLGLSSNLCQYHCDSLLLSVFLNPPPPLRLYVTQNRSPAYSCEKNGDFLTAREIIF